MELGLPTHSRLRDYFEVGSQNTASIVPGSEEHVRGHSIPPETTHPEVG